MTTRVGRARHSVRAASSVGRVTPCAPPLNDARKAAFPRSLPPMTTSGYRRKRSHRKSFTHKRLPNFLTKIVTPPLDLRLILCSNKNQLQIRYHVNIMKKLLVAFTGLACALAITVNAQDKPKHNKMTEEQKTLQKEMLEKYDTNKDGKLDKEEKAKISKEDKEKMDKAGLNHKKKKDEKKTETK